MAYGEQGPTAGHEAQVVELKTWVVGHDVPAAVRKTFAARRETQLRGVRPLL